jgi:hypothetical protein
MEGAVRSALAVVKQMIWAALKITFYKWLTKNLSANFTTSSDQN